MITIPPIPTSIVATSFTALVAALACVQFHRSRTPLRLGSAVMAICGLSISALSIVYATDKMSLSIFWVYQFVAECIAVTWVISTIIQLGYAFYPLTRHQTVIWRTALASVIIYDLVAISELSYYCYAVWGSHTLDRNSTPVIWIYWVRQMAKVLACGVTIAYLFVPLVRHHNSTGVANIADSNTLAVGTWYLSALGITSIGYCAMFVYYMTKPKEVFSPQAQALDLCIRLLACPIFSLPPPRILLRHFQDKYGSGARDDNLNTMIEDGITNNPRPRRPAMLVAQSSFPSARQNDLFFDHPSSSFLTTRPSMDFHSNYATREMEESRSKRFMEDDTHAAGTTSSSDSTAAETNNNLESGGGDGNESDPTPPSSVSSASPQVSARTTAEEITTKSTSDRKSYPVVGTDEAVLTNLGIPTRKIDFQTTPTNNPATMTTLTQHLSSPLASPVLILNSINNNSTWDEEDETAVAARRISRRLTMEGRRDGLDILNIAGRLKWPHRSNTGGHSALSTMTSISSPSSPLAMKSSQSFPSLALNRAGPGIDAPHVTLTRGGSRGAGGGRKEQLSAISSVLEGDGVMENHDDDESYFSQGQEPLHDLSKKPSSTMTHNDTSNTISSSSSNSTIRPPSPSDDPHNTTPTPSHISTELTAMDKIRRQSRDTLTRLHGDGQSAMAAAAAAAATAMTKVSTTTGPHSPMLLRRAASMGTKRRDAVDTPEQTPVELTPTSPTAIPSPPLSSLH
ncbi:hypothetical protein KI688_003363 [Linnemannia hyalina]|uniref:Uncharacterized protein n=1 Tax=Linnemannia hyalina TaxID=64524 RepID=A0A9P7XMY2_9FUNG|nr:hypothetical protein KI688_003363 [Linnemannia hyalina]